MRAGELRHEVTLQTLSSTADSQGGSSSAWVDGDTVWAAVEYLSGRELLQTEQVAAAAAVRIRMYYRADIVATMRIVWVNAGVTHTFKVDTYRPADPQNVQIHVMCTEVQL